jgi:S1-C subfamily serine protease
LGVAEIDSGSGFSQFSRPQADAPPPAQTPPHAEPALEAPPAPLAEEALPGAAYYGPYGRAAQPQAVEPAQAVAVTAAGRSTPAAPVAAPRSSAGPLLLGALMGVVAGAIAGAAVAILVVGVLDDDGDSAQAVSTEPILQSQISLIEDSAIIDAVNQAVPGVVVVYNNRGERITNFGVVESTDVGSGVIIDERGYIVTNAHVVEEGEQISVVLPGGEERPAVLISKDSPFTDLAVLKIQEGGLTSVPLGDSDSLQLGQRVIAIGNALNINETTVTTGVVSGIHRMWARENVVMTDLVQTDAAINHGNSGGALINTAGELVGLTTTIIRQTAEGNIVEGIGFAISSKMIADIAGTIVETGEYPRPDLGIEHETITPEAAAAFGLDEQNGAFITALSPNGAADQAGLRRGDIIVAINQARVTQETPLLNLLMELEPNQEVSLTYSRDGRQFETDIQLGKREL